MYCFVFIVKYNKWLAFAGFLSMAVFHIPLFLNKKVTFYKLMGSGKNGTFDIVPDFKQWAILTYSSTDELPFFIKNYFKLFKPIIKVLKLKPVCGHGFWDKKQPFGNLPKNEPVEGKMAVLTRATIRLSKLKSFWKNVPAVAQTMSEADGFITSYGIGEIPFIKQATLSIWENELAMKQFAYKMQAHKEVVAKTRKEDWYSEDMFVRFKVMD